MTLTIDIAPESQTRLEEQARRAGLPVDIYVQQLVEQAAADDAQVPHRSDEQMQGQPEVSAPPNHRSHAQAIREARTPQEKADAFMRWLDSHDRNIPALPPEAVSREGLYADDE